MTFSFTSCTDSRRLLILAVAAAVWLAQDSEADTLGKLAAFFTVLGDILALFALQPELFEQAASLCRAEEASAPPSGDQPRK